MIVRPGKEEKCSSDRWPTAQPWLNYKRRSEIDTQQEHPPHTSRLKETAWSCRCFDQEHPALHTNRSVKVYRDTRQQMELGQKAAKLEPPLFSYGDREGSCTLRRAGQGRAGDFTQTLSPPKLQSTGKTTETDGKHFCSPFSRGPTLRTEAPQTLPLPTHSPALSQTPCFSESQ